MAANGVVGAPSAQHLPERFVQFLKHLDVLCLPLPYVVSAAARIDRHPAGDLCGERAHVTARRRDVRRTRQRLLAFRPGRSHQRIVQVFDSVPGESIAALLGQREERSCRLTRVAAAVRRGRGTPSHGSGAAGRRDAGGYSMA